MLRKCTLLVVAVSLIVCWPIVAQPPNTGPPDVRIMLKKGAQQADPRIIVVGPRAAGVCYNKPDCPNNFTVMWVGSKNDGEKIRIEFTTFGADQCFDNTNFTIDGIGGAHKKTATVLADSRCTKKLFLFTISCEGGDGGDCGGVGPVDPGAMVDG